MECGKCRVKSYGSVASILGTIYNSLCCSSLMISEEEKKKQGREEGKERERLKERERRRLMKIKSLKDIFFLPLS